MPLRTFALAIALGFSLSGCALFAAIGALPIVAQVPVYASMAGGAAAVATLGLNALNDCENQGKCQKAKQALPQ